MKVDYMNGKQWGIVIVVLSVFWIISFILCVDAFSTASMILYGDMTTLPIQATTAIILTTIIPLITYKYWVGFVERVVLYISILIFPTQPRYLDVDEDINDDEEFYKYYVKEMDKRY